MNEHTPNIPEVFLKPFDPTEHENTLYKRWEESGFFNPDICIEKGIATPDAEPFSIVLPPPNVTGTLHMGHAAMLAIEDILVRYNRMLGKRTLWIPGTDSAAIATQSKVEKEILKAEKLTRHDLGREELLRRVGEFAEASKETILNQTRKMGSSLDWSRYAYTLDEKRYKAVMTAFVNMYNDGLIYRGDRIVNWDPKGQTTISDDEIVHEERQSKLYTFKYSKDFPITISTSRPETKVGDTAVAVHPDDKRYEQYVGQTFSLTFCDVPIEVTVIADKEVDPSFGTGALGVTPAHSKIDWDMADRHDITRRPQVINEYAKMTVEGRLAGLKVEVARAEVVQWLTEEGLLEKEEVITQNVATAERTGGIIEPLPKLQWWIAVNKKFILNHSEIQGISSGDKVTLKELMIATVQHGSTDIFPERFKRVYFNWITNLNDWCISRQIWFGHRIPVWYKGEEVYCGVTAPEGEGWEQDSDTLDTWFSSGLWTFSTLGWPEQTDDLRTYHPTTVLETGYDIIFFWVARMILMSTYHIGQVPFKNVYLHGLVRDEKNRKMSKSLGNTIDPLTMIEKYGADATRLSLIIGAAPGNDVPLSENKIKGYKNFANKIWNISRFVLTHTIDADMSTPTTKSARDEEILATLRTTVLEVSAEIEKFNLYLAGEKAYHYVWGELAAVVLEESKPIFAGEDMQAKLARKQVLVECLTTSLKLLHPFMPFVTETIWQELPVNMKDSELLMVAQWPTK
ncbi:MAG: valine--tRNA ligase [Candidatus Pacebacteria bacterium]|nr:valine--tRNA ligase [Candidatus Paceibacterota bacterium]